MSDTGKLTAHVNITGRGDTEMILRFAMRRMPSSHWKDIFDYMLQRTKLRGAEITNLTASDPSAHRRSHQGRFRRHRVQLLRLVGAGIEVPAAALDRQHAAGGEEDDDDDSRRRRAHQAGCDPRKLRRM